MARPQLRWPRATRFLVASTVSAAVLAGLAAVPMSPATATSTTYPDALWTRTLCGLKNFTDWLNRYHVKGYIGEVGWPGDGQPGRSDTAKWNALAEAWYQQADAAHLWVTYHNASEWQGPTNNGTVVGYSSIVPSTAVSTAHSQATVIEAHKSTPQYLRGVSTQDGTIGFAAAAATNPMSNTQPGVYGVGYDYGSDGTYAYLASRGVKLVRIAIRWERIQSSFDKPLVKAEIAHLTDAVKAAAAHGIKVIIDLHQFGRFYLGESDGLGHAISIGAPQVPLSAFIDVWTRLARTYDKNPAVIGFDLMNEPAAITPAAWHRYSQATVTALRRAGIRKTLVIEGPVWDAAGDWSTKNPRPWISDPLHKIRYEAHAWWSNHGAQYKTYVKTVADAYADGWTETPHC